MSVRKRETRAPVRCEISLPLLACVTLLALVDTPLLLQVGAAVLLHEAAHLAAIAACGQRVRAVRCSLGGLRVEAEGFGEAAVALAGPLANLVCAVCLAAVLPGEAVVQALVGALHLLPLPGADGETLLRAALPHLLPPERVEGAARAVSTATALLLFAATSVLCALGRCHWLLPLAALARYWI